MLLLFSTCYAQSVPNGSSAAAVSGWSDSGTLPHESGDDEPDPGCAQLHSDDSLERTASAPFIVTRRFLGWEARGSGSQRPWGGPGRRCL